MNSALWGWVLKSKGAKFGAGILSGGGFLGLILNLHDGVTHKIEMQEKKQKEYVELMIKPIHVKMNSMEKNSEQTRQMVRDIHQHLLKSQRK